MKEDCAELHTFILSGGRWHVYAGRWLTKISSAPGVLFPIFARALGLTKNSLILRKEDANTAPNSNTAEIIVGKNARAFLGGEMHKFLQHKVKAAGGDPKQVAPLRFGGERKVGGVRIAIVPVTHSNGIGSNFLNEELGHLLQQNGLTAYAGPDNGYILTFSNGLVVYLSGDGGIFADLDVTVRGYYGAELAVINAGGISTSGPKEAAYSISTLVRPKAVIPHHMNEAATENGTVKPDTKKSQFTELISVIPVYIPISGHTIEFDGDGKCKSGC